MTSLERTKRVVASAYATRHGDATARALVTALERENDVLSARIAASNDVSGVVVVHPSGAVVKSIR